MSLPFSNLQSRLSKSRGVSRLKSLSTSLSVLRNLIFLLFLFRWSRKSLYFVRGHGLLGSVTFTYALLYKRAYNLFLRAPGIRSQVDKQVATAVKGIEVRLISNEGAKYPSLPKEPWSAEQVKAEMDQLVGMKRTRWEEGKVSGAVYHGEDQLLDVQAEAMRHFSVSNPIHADVFPAVRKMEAEVVSMVLGLFNAPKDGAGTTTSGGTESILMACLSARQKAYTERGVTEPEMIIPSTAHAAFLKAATYFKIKLHLIPCPAPAYRVSIPKLRRFINPNTILLVGSAPNYPHGIVDDIPALSRLALHHHIPLHVDCCLGSFLLPCLAAAGFPSPYADAGGFDFRQPGVTSISIDTHKYGFAPKGSSVVLYRTPALRAHGYFVAPDWAGGVYGSPTLAGSRPGALIAGAWATMMATGEAGYVDATHKIVGARITIQNAVAEHPGLNTVLRVLGEPSVSVVAVECVDAALDIYDIADGMSARGYHLSSLQDPPGLHVAVTLPMTKSGAIEAMIEALVAVVAAEREKAAKRIAEGGSVEKVRGNSAQLYGVAGSLPDKSIVERLVVGYIDTLYKV